MSHADQESFSSPSAGSDGEAHEASSVRPGGEQSGDPPRDAEGGNEPKSPPQDSSPKSATVAVRGEMLDEQNPSDDSKEAAPKDQQASENKSDQDEPSRDKKSSQDKSSKPVLEAKVEKQKRLPSLDDDGDVGVQRDHLVTRDGQADLAFTGTLLASAAPAFAPEGRWQEYRVYATTGGKHVFSKVNRSVFVEERDAHQAEVFDPTPTSMPSQLLHKARDLIARPVTWTDAAATFFGYDPLAKLLYRRLGGQFEEHVS